MAVPWLDILDTVIAVADLARTAAGGRGHDKPPPERKAQPDVSARAGSGLDMQIAGIVTALKEAAVRDTRRMDLEREQRAAERQRAERALQIELQRQTGDREIGRLRLLAGVAAMAWIATIVTLAWSTRPIGGSLAARVSLGFGWLFLLGAIAASFLAQSRAAAAVDALANGDESRYGPIRSGVSRILPLWLLIGGLVLAGLAALIV